MHWLHSWLSSSCAPVPPGSVSVGLGWLLPVVSWYHGHTFRTGGVIWHLNPIFSAPRSQCRPTPGTTEPNWISTGDL